MKRQLLYKYFMHTDIPHIKNDDIIEKINHNNNPLIIKFLSDKCSMNDVIALLSTNLQWDRQMTLLLMSKFGLFTRHICDFNGYTYNQQIGSKFTLFINHINEKVNNYTYDITTIQEAITIGFTEFIAHAFEINFKFTEDCFKQAISYNFLNKIFQDKSGNYNLMKKMIMSGLKLSQNIFEYLCERINPIFDLNEYDIFELLLENKIIPTTKGIHSMIKNSYMFRSGGNEPEKIAKIITLCVEYGYKLTQYDMLFATKYHIELENIEIYDFDHGTEFLNICSSAGFFPYMKYLNMNEKTMYNFEKSCTVKQIAPIRRAIVKKIMPTFMCLVHAAQIPNNRHIVQLLLVTGIIFPGIEIMKNICKTYPDESKYNSALVAIIDFVVGYMADDVTQIDPMDIIYKYIDNSESQFEKNPTILKSLKGAYFSTFNDNIECKLNPTFFEKNNVRTNKCLLNTKHPCFDMHDLLSSEDNEKNMKNLLPINIFNNKYNNITVDMPNPVKQPKKVIAKKNIVASELSSSDSDSNTNIESNISSSDESVIEIKKVRSTVQKKTLAAKASKANKNLDKNDKITKPKKITETKKIKQSKIDDGDLQNVKQNCKIVIENDVVKPIVDPTKIPLDFNYKEIRTIKNNVVDMLKLKKKNKMTFIDIRKKLMEYFDEEELIGNDVINVNSELQKLMPKKTKFIEMKNIDTFIYSLIQI